MTCNPSKTRDYTRDTLPKQESCDCQNRMRRDVDTAGLVGLDGAIRMSGDPGSLPWNIEKQAFIWGGGGVGWA